MKSGEPNAVGPVDAGAVRDEVITGPMGPEEKEEKLWLKSLFMKLLLLLLLLLMVLLLLLLFSLLWSMRE